MSQLFSRRSAIKAGAGGALAAAASLAMVGGASAPAQAATVAVPESATKKFGTIRHTDTRLVPASISYDGVQTREIVNQLKPGNRETRPVHVITAHWPKGPNEVLVPSSYASKAEAVDLGNKYIAVLGLIPRALRVHVKKVHVIPGNHAVTGGNGNINLYTGPDANHPWSHYPNMFTHEAAHTVNNVFRANPQLLAQWNAAVQADRQRGTVNGGFISLYAARNPTTEDFGESLVSWLSVKFHPDRLRAVNPDFPAFIRNQIPNRIKFFNAHITDLVPLANA